MVAGFCGSTCQLVAQAVLEKKVWMDLLKESFLAVVESLEMTIILLHTLAPAAFGWSSSNSDDSHDRRGFAFSQF